MEAILDTANEWLKLRNEKDATRKVSRLAPSSLLFCRLHCHTVRICIVMHRIMYKIFFGAIGNSEKGLPGKSASESTVQVGEICQ